MTEAGPVDEWAHKRGVAAVRRFAVLSALSFALVLVPAATASAAVSVTLAGSGAGTVTSNVGTPLIECSINGGVVTGNCSTTPVLGAGDVALTAQAAPGSYFEGWVVGASLCTGTTSPCTLQFSEFGVPYSVTASFQIAPDPPTATIGSASAGHATYVKELHGDINPEGAAVSGCYFEYGTTTDYGRTSPCVPSAAGLGSGTENVAVSALAGPLEPNTTYNYRLVASNLGGTSQSENRTFTSDPAPPDGCSNADIRAQQGIGTILLPDCMALEMVSPASKYNQRTRWPTGLGDGERVLFDAASAVNADTPGYRSYGSERYVATRGTAGWVTEAAVAPANAPHELADGGDAAKANSFAPDLTSWFHTAATRQQADSGIIRVFRGGLGGAFSPASPLLIPWDPGTNKLLTANYAPVVSSSADQSHVFFQPGDATSRNAAIGTLPPDHTVGYLPGDPRPSGSAAAFNVYVASPAADGAPSLALLARDADGKAWGGNCGTRVGDIKAESGVPAEATVRRQGAISDDGLRVYLTTRPTQPPTGDCNANNRLRILERLVTPSGPQIRELIDSECERVADFEAEPPIPACSATDGDDFYQGASVDQTKVYFTTTRQLADSDLDGGATACARTVAVAGCDLYLYDGTRPAGERLTQVSAGEATAAHPVPGAGARVYNSITAISGDGSRAYFVALGVLTDRENPVGDTAVDGQPNLYTWDVETREVAFIGTLDAGDATGLWGSIGGTFNNQAFPVPAMGKDLAGSEVGGAGHILVFSSRAALTSDDEDGTRTDIYRYDATEEALERVVRAAPGASDNGAFDIVTGGGFRRHVAIGPGYVETGRWVSEDGRAVVFMTAEGLLPEDVDGRRDSYLWRDGQLARLPGTTETDAALPGGELRDQPVLSRDGSTVAFQSYRQLVRADRDTSMSLYVARVDGGFAEPAPAAERCDPLLDGCQGGGFGSVSSDTKTQSSPESGNAKTEARKTLVVSRLSKKARRKASRSGRLSVKVRASSTGRVSLTVKARLGKKVRRVGRASKRAVKGRAVTVNIRLSSAAKKRLRAGEKLRLTVEVRQFGARTRTRSILLPGVKS